MELEVPDLPIATTSTSKQWPDLPLGMSRGIENDAYHGDRSAVSSTRLKRMLISPAHFLAGFTDPEESTEAMQYGTVLHGRLLEPATFAQRFYPMKKVNRTTKEGKALYADYLAEAAGRFVFPLDWLEGIERIVDNAHMHRRVRSILSDGEAEVAFAWIDEETGIKLKVKADWLSSRFDLLSDVKSAADVTQAGFSKAAARLDYPLSAAMYCEGVRAVTGVSAEWAFIACEKEPPHTVAAYRATEAFMRRGRAMFRGALRRLAECRARGAFPMLQGEGEWETIDLPRWY